MAGTSYTRQSTISDGNIITAALFNSEFNQLLNAFVYASSGTQGHCHDGSAGQGGAISKIGDQDFKNKIEVSAANNRIEFYAEVGGSPVEQVRIQDGAIVPVTNDDVDLGTSSLNFKSLYISNEIKFGTSTIGLSGSEIFIADATAGLKMSGGDTNNILPVDASGTATDRVTDFGSSTKRFNVGYFNQLDVVGTHDTVVTIRSTGETGSEDADATLNIKAAETGEALVVLYAADNTNSKGFMGWDTSSGPQLALQTEGSGSRVVIKPEDTDTVKFEVAETTFLKNAKIEHGVNDGQAQLYIHNSGTGDADATLKLESSDIGEAEINFYNDGNWGATIESFIKEAIPAQLNIKTFGAGSAIDLQPEDVNVLRARKTSVTLAPNSTATLDATENAVAITGTLSTSGLYSATGGIKLADSQKIQLGTSNDLEIYHNGSNSIIEDAGTGSLVIAGSTIQISTGIGSGHQSVAAFDSSGATTLTHNTNTKFETSSAGVTITGDATVSGAVGAQTVNASSSIDTPIIEVTTLKARDGSAAGSIADSTGVVTLASSVLTTADINGGTADNVVIGGSTAAAGTFTQVNTASVKAADGTGALTIANSTGIVSFGSITTTAFVATTADINGGSIDGTAIGGSAAAVGTFTTLNATTVDTTNIEVTNLKAKDGTSAGSIADSTGVVTLGSSVLTTTDINGGTVDNVVIGGSTAAAGTFTTGTIATADINGGAIDGTTIGGSSAAAGSFTTLGATGLISGTDLTLTDATPAITMSDSDGTNQKVELVQVGGSFIATVRDDTSHGSIEFKSHNGTDNLTRFKVAPDGDFNFYNNVAVTKMKWDAPNARLGIGTNAPAQTLHVEGKIIATEGIYLGGTTSPNLLDDYEEGTWTPVMRDEESGGNVAGASNLSGVYTKIGNQVTLTLRVINVSKTGMTSGNDIYITGLPFTASDLSPSYRHIGSAESVSITFDKSLQSRITENTSYIQLSNSEADGGLATINWSAVAADDSGSGVADLFITHTYIAD